MPRLGGKQHSLSPPVNQGINGTGSHANSRAVHKPLLQTAAVQKRSHMEFKGVPEKAFSPAAGDRGGGLMTSKNSKAHQLGWERSSLNQSQAPPSMG